MRQLRAKPLAIALALAACSTAPAERAASLPPAPVPKPQSAEAPGLPPPAPQSQQDVAVAPLPVLPPRGRQDPSLAPERLVGLSEDDVRRLIGAPAMVREEPPALVWRYSSTRCGLNLFFYMDMASRTFRALTYELKPTGPDGLDGSACLASLRPAPP